jgi:putative heme-binding domain-containing protein
MAAQDSLPTQLRAAAIANLGTCNDPSITRELLAMNSGLPADLRDGVRDVLVSRPSSAAELIAAVENKAIPAADVSTLQLRRIAEHHDVDLDRRVLAIWGQVREGTPEERLAVVRRLNNDLRATSGDATAGQKMFREHCGTCHKLFGDGNTVGPDLTTANRQDRDFLLVSLVDPSAHVRKEFMSYVCQTTDGRVLTGLLVDESPAGITLLDAKNQRTSLARGQIDQLEPAGQSLMPEGIIEKLTPQQLRDLFAYVQSPAAPAQSARKGPN